MCEYVSERELYSAFSISFVFNTKNTFIHHTVVAFFLVDRRGMKNRAHLRYSIFFLLVLFFIVVKTMHFVYNAMHLDIYAYFMMFVLA